MFKVTYKDTPKPRKHYTVYDIRYDGAGYPHFVIYQDGQWLCKSAKHFEPVEGRKVND
jgi:hypothetical protein